MLNLEIAAGEVEDTPARTAGVFSGCDQAGMRQLRYAELLSV